MTAVETPEFDLRFTDHEERVEFFNRLEYDGVSLGTAMKQARWTKLGIWSDKQKFKEDIARILRVEVIIYHRKHFSQFGKWEDPQVEDILASVTFNRAFALAIKPMANKLENDMREAIECYKNRPTYPEELTTEEQEEVDAAYATVHAELASMTQYRTGFKDGLTDIIKSLAYPDPKKRPKKKLLKKGTKRRINRFGQHPHGEAVSRVLSEIHDVEED